MKLRWLRDDRGSMPFALLLTMVGVSLSAMLTPMVISQFGATRLDVRRIHALHAAQAGLDVAMAHLRAAADEENRGRVDQLPCQPLAGSVRAGSSARYKVWIDYFTSDPRGRWDTVAAWPPRGQTEDHWIQLNRLTCDGTLRQTPAYALLRSIGTASDEGAIDVAEGRRLYGTYRLKTTNENIAGGLIHAYKLPNSRDLCLDAGSGAPTAGTALVMQPCTPGASRQIFAYNPNLTITLVSSKTATNPLGMCLDAGPAPKRQDQVRFEPCGANTLPQQQWSINDDSNLEGTTNGTTLSNNCLNVKNPNVAGSLVVVGVCRGAYDNVKTFTLEASVGAGAAGGATSQVVNFSQFGRCMDITKFNINYGYLIVWPCKQAPNAASVGWNQKFTVPAVPGGADFGTGSIEARNGSTRYCLHSPGTLGYGVYPTMKACPATLTPNFTWKYYGRTGSYSTSYVAVDFKGNCLTPTDPTATPPDLHPEGTATSKITLARCDGSTLQKWNAPANLLQPLPLKDIGER